MDLQSISDAIRPYWVVWLMAMFLGVLWWAFRPKNKERFEEDSKIPFQDD